MIIMMMVHAKAHREQGRGERDGYPSSAIVVQGRKKGKGRANEGKSGGKSRDRNMSVCVSFLFPSKTG
jgi:hypothetical protein